MTLSLYFTWFSYTSLCYLAPSLFYFVFFFFLVVGTPPSFVEQPSDTVVHETVSYDINDTPMNLVLHCLVTGSPTPSVSWFRGDTNITDQGLLLSNGTIGLNITEGTNGATKDGVAYHCTATNIIGPENATATIRSRDANVSLSCKFFKSMLSWMFVFVCYYCCSCCCCCCFVVGEFFINHMCIIIHLYVRQHSLRVLKPLQTWLQSANITSFFFF